tara:strand:+ start:1784 stop:2914 length:1131 start_codon:yes stop_codon:yes gene_type:complete
MSDPGIIFLLEDGRLAGPHVYIARLFQYLPGKNRVLIPKDSQKVKKLFDSNNVDYEETFFLSRLSREPIRVMRYIIFFIPEIIFLIIHFSLSKEKVIYCAGGSWQIKGAISGFLARKVVIWHLNDTYVPKIIKIIFTIISSLANGYIYASEATKDYYADAVKERENMVIQAPVDENKFRASSRDYYLNNKEIINVGTVCNVNPLKNLEDFIEVARVLSKSSTQKFYFKIIGPIFDSQNEYKNKLLNLINKYNLTNIELSGPSYNVEDELKKLDIFLFTSKTESSPISVWEAMMMGLPIVSYRVGDVGKYVQNNLNGFTAEIFDTKKLVKGINQIIEKDLSLKMSRTSEEVAHKYFSSKKCAQLHIEYIENLVKQYS